MCFWAKKKRLIEIVLLSTHNICFALEIKEINFQCALLSGSLNLALYLFNDLNVVCALVWIRQHGYKLLNII